VDSSLERIQVKLSGVTTESRYAVTCNGRRVPLRPTGEPGEAIAGVRYRARRLSAALHPTIRVHAPLVFEIIDGWNERSMARCTYRVGPAEGRNYTSLPENASEAEQRRRERFQVSDPAPGPRTAPKEETNPIFPMTLDLRLPASGPETHKNSGLVP
jgi:uncharacterized protein (DUF2126 family)